MSPLRKTDYLTCVVIAMSLIIGSVLQGCGGGGGGGTTTPSPSPGKTTTIITTTGTTTTSTPAHARTKPLSVEEAVKVLNEQYMSWVMPDMAQPPDPDCIRTPTVECVGKPKQTHLGVTLSFAAQTWDFQQNLYCHPFTPTGCFDGYADCRMSASLFNWKIASQDYKWPGTFGRYVAYVFNQTLVEEKMGKCVFLYDGATELRLNNGCAGVGGQRTCAADGGSAYDNICPSTGKVCTANDTEVKGGMCKPSGQLDPPKDGPGGQQCFYSMPALNYPTIDRPNQLKESLVQRIVNELDPKGTGDYVQYNELVIDERVLIPEIVYDPAVTIPAFVFVKSGGDVGLKNATAMRDKFSRDYQVDKIPIIGLDDQNDFRSRTPPGPFYVPKALDETEVVI